MFEIIRGFSEIRAGSNRNFGLVFAGVFTLVALWPLWRGGSLRIWALAVGAVFLLIALLLPRTLGPLNFIWFKFGMLLGALVSPVVMAVIFYFVVTPTAFIVGIAGKDPLRMRIDRNARSYWIRRDEDSHPASSMKNQF